MSSVRSSFEESLLVRMLLLSEGDGMDDIVVFLLSSESIGVEAMMVISKE